MKNFQRFFSFYRTSTVCGLRNSQIPNTLMEIKFCSKIKKIQILCARIKEMLNHGLEPWTLGLLDLRPNQLS